MSVKAASIVTADLLADSTIENNKNISFNYLGTYSQCIDFVMVCHLLVSVQFVQKLNSAYKKAIQCIHGWVHINSCMMIMLWLLVNKQIRDNYFI